ncbi:MAG: tripartite tricarboxylate transporter substrate binding protein [Burkholderiales bacterium]|nr:tripartite tricarboxylate transporter substrate binding protein [Burkholderiales bacterium]
MPGHSIPRRQLLATSAAALCLPAWAQASYPDRPVKVVIPNAPGSSVDTIGRVVCAEMAKALPQPFVMDNRAGAAGALGVEIARTAAPDGYTLLVGSTSAITVAPLLQKAVSYQPLRDFDFISLMALLPNVLVCNPALPVQTTAQLIAYCKAKNGQTNMASAGIGSASHLAGAALQAFGGFKSLHVPYKGGSQGVASVVSGETDWVLTPAPAAMSLVAAGRLRLLGHSMAASLKPLGETPAIEAAVPGFEFASWIGLMAPRGLPARVTDALSKSLAQALQRAELRQAFETNGAVPHASTAEAFRAHVTRDIEVNRKAVAAAGVQAE